MLEGRPEHPSKVTDLNDYRRISAERENLARGITPADASDGPRSNTDRADFSAAQYIVDVFRHEPECSDANIASIKVPDDKNMLSTFIRWHLEAPDSFAEPFIYAVAKKYLDSRTLQEAASS